MIQRFGALAGGAAKKTEKKAKAFPIGADKNCRATYDLSGEAERREQMVTVRDGKPGGGDTDVTQTQGRLLWPCR
jgi:hypothetical protein